jgi:hypothetical protein
MSEKCEVNFVGVLVLCRSYEKYVMQCCFGRNGIYIFGDLFACNLENSEQNI